MTSPSGRTTRTSRQRRSKLRSFVTAIQTLILLGVSASVGVALAFFINLSPMLPTVGDFQSPEATIVYSCDNVILGRIFREDRTNVPLKDIPKILQDATVAIEDSRFYHHSGVDMKGIVRAVWQNVRGQRMAQGGSTITQQLARNVYLTQKKTLDRKLQEMVLAILMERNFTKDKILELYMNQVYYGSGAFGVQAASRVYFGKDVDQLDLSEAAMIAGMTQKPSGYSPHEDKAAAIGRRNKVLSRMCELGYINSQQRDRAKAKKLVVISRSSGRNTYKAPHFVDYVTKQLRERYGDDVIFAGGLRVYTTLNYKMQQAAELALRKGVHDHERSSRVSEGCFICIEPQNGYIRAMVGSVDPASQYNRCTQAPRQPGSSFKAFVYTAALMEGDTPNTTVEGSQKTWPGGNGRLWRPRNYDGKYPPRVSYKTAVANSINTAAIRVADKVGIRNVIKYAQLMGIKSELPPYLSTAIGGIPGLHAIEMASAYGTFANDGVHVEPCAIIRITNSHGEPVEDFLPEGQRVIPERVNKMMDEMFRAVVTMGTGRNARRVSNARGKTGTTNEDVDAWFLGYVPNKLVAACWVGNDDNSPMRKAYGGTVCAPIWTQFMLKAIPVFDNTHKDDDTSGDRRARSSKNTEQDNSNNASRPIAERSVGADVVTAHDSDLVSVKTCSASRLLANSACPSVINQRMLRGTEPKTYCNVHSAVKTEPAATSDPDATYVTVQVCSESGMLVGPGCPGSVRKRVLAENVPVQECTVHNHSRE